MLKKKIIKYDYYKKKQKEITEMEISKSFASTR